MTDLQIRFGQEWVQSAKKEIDDFDGAMKMLAIVLPILEKSQVKITLPPLLCLGGLSLKSSNVKLNVHIDENEFRFHWFKWETEGSQMTLHSDFASYCFDYDGEEGTFPIKTFEEVPELLELELRKLDQYQK